MIDLNEIREDFGLHTDYYLELVTDRVEKGISNFDVVTLGDYLDEVILNGLKRFKELEPEGPEGLDPKDWINYINDMISLSQGIVNNNEKIYNLTIDEMFDLDKVDEIEAENAAYRKELFDMMTDSWELLYV